MSKKVLGAPTLALALAIGAGGAAAQAAPTQWYTAKGGLVTASTAVVLNGKLSFHFTAGKTKYVTKCTAIAKGTVSNTGTESAGVDELTSGELVGCATKPSFCGGGTETDLLRGFPWGSRLAAGPPIRDELGFSEFALYCGGGLQRSSGGLVSPLLKSSALAFDKGHGELAGNGGVTVTGKWPMRTEGGDKLEAH
jgi:hypothetical protein